MTTAQPQTKKNAKLLEQQRKLFNVLEAVIKTDPMPPEWKASALMAHAVKLYCMSNCDPVKTMRAILLAWDCCNLAVSHEAKANNPGN